jgi:hypothetical protein
MEGASFAAATALHTKLNNLRVAASNGDETLLAVVTLLDGMCFALQLQPPLAPEAYFSGILALLEGAGASKANEVSLVNNRAAESEHCPA